MLRWLPMAAAFLTVAALGAGPDRAQGASATSQPLTIKAKIPLPDSPIQMNAAFGSVWMLDGAIQSSQLLRLNIATGRVEHAIQLGPPAPNDSENPGPMAIGKNAVWVAKYWQNTVQRVSPSTNRVVQTVRVGISPNGLVAGFGSIWVANSNSASVSRISQATGRVTATIHVGTATAFAGGPAYLARNSTGIWATIPVLHEIVEINPSTDRVERTIPTDSAGTCGSMTFVPHAVWLDALGCGLNEIARIDLRTGATTARIAVGRWFVSLMAVRDGSLWIAHNSWFNPNTFTGGGGVLEQRDPTTGRVEATYSLGHGDGLAGPLFVGDTLWQANFFTNTLNLFQAPPATPPLASTATASPMARAVPSRHSPRVPAEQSDPPITTAPAAGFTKAGFGSLWLLAPTDLATNTSLLRVNPTTRNVTRFPMGLPAAPQVAIAGGAVWVAKYYENTVWRIDPANGRRVAVIPVGLQPDAILAADGFVWVTNHHSHSLSKIDPVSSHVVATYQVGAKEFRSGPLQIGPGHGSLWIGVPNQGAYVRLDPRTGRLIATVPLALGDPCGGSPVAVSGGEWVNDNCSQIERIDATSNTITATAVVSPAGSSVTDIAYGDHVLWTVGDRNVDPYSGEGTPGVLDARAPSTGAVRREWIMSGTNASADSVVNAFGALWIGDSVNGMLRRFPLPAGP
ncbi:MAG: virginiamycin lyase [Solirubrobacteraceae bacterium]|nr:virginiamycin lyase [Solirubrobacteraceae bacterium]